MHLFVYFKFDSSLTTHVHATAHRLQSALIAEFPSLEALLLKRPQIDEKGLTTWMESYQIDDQDLALFQTRLQALATLLELPLPRHTEIFVPVDSPN